MNPKRSQPHATPHGSPHASPHAKEDELRELARGRGGARAGAHVRACPPCREATALYRELSRPIAPSPALSACPPSPDLVHLAELPPSRRASSPLGIHLAACRDCRLELAGLERLSAEARPLPVLRHTEPRTASILSRLRGLVSFDMPAHLALNPRGARRPAQSPQFLRAMKAYRARRYPEAVSELSRARKGGDVSPALDLYLGVTLLQLGRAAAAVTVLEQAVAARRGDGERRWYLAQALLRRGRGAEALRELRAAARLAGPQRERACALAGRVEALVAPAEG